MLSEFDAILAEAKKFFGTGDFESAKEYAKDARDILKDEQDILQMGDFDDDGTDEVEESDAHSEGTTIKGGDGNEIRKQQ